MKLKKIFKSITSTLLVLAMLMSILPIAAFATETDEITVYLTLSVDGDFLTSEITGEKMARVPITLSYFDLADYGLEKYYRYETEGEGGEYINTTIVEKPTVLHLYIRALEEYYLGKKYTLDDTKALEPSGDPTSFYMLNFWGHDENLMYFVDHEYPLMSSGWGATADYVVIEDGMEIDVAMFTSWEFYNSGYFSYFQNGDELTVNEGDTVDFTVMGASTNAWGASEGPIQLGNDLISVCCGDSLDTLEEKQLDDNNVCSITFDKAGTYYVVARDVNYNDTELACIAPAITKVNVEESVQEGEYEVAVNVAPSTASVRFYNCGGFDENGYDVLGKELRVTDNGVNSETSYHTYTMKLNKGTYSFRATDANGNSLGGMTFDIPTAVEVDNIESKSSEIYLRQVDVYTTTKIDGVFAKESQYSTKVMDADGKIATAGKSYIDSNGRTRYPYMIYANGNAELYTFKFIPTDDVSNTANVGTNTTINQAIGRGTTITTKSSTLPDLINAVISAPTGSKVQVFNQLRNFYTEEILYASKSDQNGITDYTYRLPKSNGNHTYRVSKEGKITKAGYLNLNSDDKAKTTITFAEDENSKIRPDYDRKTTIGSRLEDNILLNINSQNYLRMNVGDTFKARAYRAWQIINSDTANIMIEPDFEYKIIRGDSITIEQQGQNAVVKAVKNGISIVEVTYDAIEIGGNTKYTGIYGAIDPMRKGLFVVNVGGSTDTEIIMPEWDSDFDTIYFTEDSGTYKFTPESEAALTVKCNDQKVEKNADNSYTLPINQGNNIVSVTAGDTTEYVIIKGNKVSVNIENTTSPDEPIRQGDTIKISFDGLHIPMPKFSGIYNPGYGNTIKATYQKENGRYVQGTGSQYNFITNHAISMTVYDKGTIKLTNGTIPFTSMGFVPGAHRELTDTGVGANFNAVEVPAEFSHLPDITFEVLKNEDLSYMDNAKETYTNLSKVNILCGTSTYQKAFNINLAGTNANKKNTTTTFTSFNTEFPISVTATPLNDNVTMEFRYWELGDTEKKTLSLKPDKTTTLDNPFSGEKTIYMEIAVTPVNPVFGEQTIYSYVVYKSDLEKPILKTLNIKDADGNAFSAPYGVLYSENNSGIAYTQTDYYCYIPKNTDKVTVSLARLNGTSDITIGEETKSIKISETAFSAISVPNDETSLTISLADGTEYTVKLIKTDKVMQKKVVYDNEMVSVSFINMKALNLDFYIAAYEDETNRMSKIMITSKEVIAGENTAFIDLSEFEGLDNIKLFVWDKNSSPIFDKIDINLE